MVQHRAFFWIFFGSLFLAILAGHQSLEVIDRDEARFAQASKQMLLTGDLITPYFMDEIRAKKPIAIYWLQSASAALFGHLDIASYRLPSLLGFLASLALSWRLATCLWPAISFLPVVTILLLAASPVMIAEAHLAKTDSVLLAVILCQQYFLWQIYQRQASRRTSQMVGFWVSMGVAILLKGPIAPLLAMTTLGVLALLERRIKWMIHLSLFRGFLILSILTLPWAIAVSYQTNGAFLDIAVQGDFLSKVKSGQESHGAPFGTYFALLGLLFWPGITFAGFIVWQGRGILEHPASRFCLAWISGYWLVIELVPTKLPHYILPVLPALALLAAFSLLSALPPATKLQRLAIRIGYGISIIWGIVIAGCSFWLALSFGGITGGWAFVFAMLIALLVCFVLWRLWHWYHGQNFTDLLAINVAGIAVHLVLVAGLFASLSYVHISQRLKTQIFSLPNSPAAIALVGYHEPSAVFHLGQDILLLDPKQAALFMAEAPDGLAVIEGRQRDAFLQYAQELQQQLGVTAIVSGINISKGRDTELFLYQHLPTSPPSD